MTSRSPTFARVRAMIGVGDYLPASQDGETVAGVANTYNIAEAAAWVTAIASAAPTGKTDAAESTYLSTCLTAAITAGYTNGSQTGGVGAGNSANGVGISIVTRLLALGVNDLSS